METSTDDFGRQTLYNDELKRARKLADSQYRLEEDHVKSVVKAQGTSFNPRSREVRKRIHEVALTDLEDQVRSVSSLRQSLCDDLQILRDLEKQVAFMQETMENDLNRIVSKKEDELVAALK